MLGWALWKRGETRGRSRRGTLGGDRARARLLATEGWALNLVGMTYATLETCRAGSISAVAPRGWVAPPATRAAKRWRSTTPAGVLYRADRLEDAGETLRAVVKLQRRPRTAAGRGPRTCQPGGCIGGLGGAPRPRRPTGARFAGPRREGPRRRGPCTRGSWSPRRGVGRPGWSAAFLRRGAGASSATGGPGRRGPGRLGLARLDEAQGRLDAARARIQVALDRLEAMKVRFRSPDVRVFASASTQPLYDFAVDVLMKLMRPPRPAASTDWPSRWRRGAAPGFFWRISRNSRSSRDCPRPDPRRSPGFAAARGRARHLRRRRRAALRLRRDARLFFRATPGGGSAGALGPPRERARPRVDGRWLRLASPYTEALRDLVSPWRRSCRPGFHAWSSFRTDSSHAFRSRCWRGRRRLASSCRGFRDRLCPVVERPRAAPRGARRSARQPARPPRRRRPRTRLERVSLLYEDEGFVPRAASLRERRGSPRRPLRGRGKRPPRRS